MLDRVRDNALEIQHEYRTGQRPDSIGIFVLKPDSLPEDKETVASELEAHDLSVLTVVEGELAVSAVCALYYSELQYRPTDAVYGNTWRPRFVNHMTTGESTLFVVNGLDVEAACVEVKHGIRQKHNKLAVPIPRDDDEFYEKIIKNVAHSVDEEHVEPALWTLPEMFREVHSLTISAAALSDEN